MKISDFEDLSNHMSDISALFEKENEPWKAHAFSTAASYFRTRHAELEIIDDKLTEKIPGVGNAIQAVIVEFVKTGTSEKWQKLSAENEPIATTKRHNAVECRSTISKLLLPLSEKGIKWGFAGSMRRRAPTVKDVDVIVSQESASTRDIVLEYLKEHGFEPTIRNGYVKVGIEVPIGDDKVTLDLNFAEPESIGAYYLYFTGSKEFNIAQRRRAKEKGMLLNQKGLFRDGVKIAGETEQEIFEALGEEFVAPEERV